MKRKNYLAAIAVLSASAVGSAYASRSVENDAYAIESAKIGLAQAIRTAEQHVGGKASRAEFERHEGRGVVDVEVVSGQKVLEIKVDSTTGAILATSANHADRDDEHDADD